eukprot:UN31925
MLSVQSIPVHIRKCSLIYYIIRIVKTKWKYFVVYIIVVHIIRICRKIYKRYTQPIDDRTLIAFSGTGLMYAWNIGVYSYLKYNFNIDNLRISGVSGGCLPVMAKIGEYTDELGLELLISSWKQLTERALGPFLCLPDLLLNDPLPPSEALVIRIRT